MWKTSEAPDDFGMQFCPAGKVGIAERAHQCDGALLVGEAFGVLERQIEEQALGRRDLSVESAHDCASGRGARKRIGRESIRLAAEHVARKLIEDENEG